MTIEVLHSDDNDPTCQTFVFRGEDHSFANSLRMAINYNEHVEFCGYTIVHPMDDSFRIRIQTDRTTTAAEALAKGLDDLSTMTLELMAAVHSNLKEKNFAIEHTAQW